MYKSFTPNRLSQAVLLTCLSMAGHSAVAEGENYALEEVVVTAQKRAQAIQDVPISVSAISGAKIADAGISDMDDLSRHVPNLNISTGNNTQIRMRGLGSGLNKGFEQSVGMYIDGIYFGRDRSYRGSLLDLERVEVLRGPQGILFGKNTIAGAINVTTAKPSQEFEGEVGLTYGSYGERKVSGVLSGPISDTLSGRIAFSDESQDGYLDNSIASADDGVGVENRTVRATLQWEPSDQLVSTLKLEKGDYERRGTTYQVTNPGVFSDAYFSAFTPGFESRFNDETHIDSTLGDQKEKTETDNVTLNVEYEFDQFTLASTTGYIGFDSDDGLDVDFSPAPVLFQNAKQDYEQFSQEFRLSSPGGETIDYIIGVYYQSSEFEFNNHTLLNLDPVPLVNGQAATLKDFDQESESYSAFGEVVWNISDKFSLTGGLRYTRETKEADSRLTTLELNGAAASPATQGLLAAFGNVAHVQSGERTESNVTPLIKATYYFTDDIMGYVTASTGFKGGGFNTEVNNPAASPFEFEEESSKAVEVGLKSTLLDGAATFNVSIFKTEFDDLQVSGFEGLAFIVGNAAKATSQGVEIDGMWRVSERLTLGGSYSYLDAEYDDYDNAPCTVAQKAASAVPASCQQDLSGRPLHYAPENTASLNAEYEMPVGEDYELSFAVDLNYSDDFFLQNDLDPEDSQESFTKVNARVVVKNLLDDWELALIGKNLTDKRTANNATDLPVLENGAHAKNTMPPRTVALQLKMRF